MTRWIVEPRLRALESVAWCRTWLQRFDLSRLDWVRIDQGRIDGGGVYGRCWYLDRRKGKGYRISCQVPGPYPTRVRLRFPPLYRQPDGTWPPVPLDLEPGGYVQAVGSDGEKREWLRLTKALLLDTLDEGVVWILGHEAFHFLRKTRQVQGRNVEWQADAFAGSLLEDWRRGASPAGWSATASPPTVPSRQPLLSMHPRSN